MPSYRLWATLFATSVLFSSLNSDSLQEKETEDLYPDVDATFAPTVMIVLLLRNKAHTLPYTLHYLDRLNYPKDRISLYIRTDNNEDATEEIVLSWLDKVGDQYNTYHADVGDGAPKLSSTKWTDERFDYIMSIKQEALEHARKRWADFVWFHDADAFVTNSDTLREMVATGHTVVAPLLTSLGLYANFWAGMTEGYYYKRTDEYLPIKNRKTPGCHEVPMVHSSFLIDLRRVDSRKLTFLPENIPNYKGPRDDIIVFALSATVNDIALTICNTDVYGYITLPLESGETIDNDLQHLSDLKLQMIADHSYVGYREDLKDYMPKDMPKDSLGVDKVYMVNLERRPERKVLMDACFDELGIEFEWVKAVDGKTMNKAFLEERGIKMMPDFSEPYHKRALTFGEIGCFLSHYGIWQDVVKSGHDVVIVMEDDIRFDPYFRGNLAWLKKDLKRFTPDWDLVFLGRKILHDVNEPFVEGSHRIVHVGYTYWTLGYMLTRAGAQKLLDEQPLGKMVPVDEYLPIMFDKHPNETWKSHYKNRDLKAYSAEPLLLHPTHYTGEKGYISDTEDTGTIASGPQESNQKSNDEL